MLALTWYPDARQGLHKRVDSNSTKCLLLGLTDYAIACVSLDVHVKPWMLLKYFVCVDTPEGIVDGSLHRVVKYLLHEKLFVLIPLLLYESESFDVAVHFDFKKNK